MQISTKFSLGDTVWTVNLLDLKVITFEVGRIGVSLTQNNGTNVDLYPTDGKGGYDYHSYSEAKCYHSYEELMQHMTGE